MTVVNIPLGEWLPDLPAAQNPGCEVARNVLPAAVGFKPFSSLVGQGETITGQVIGAEQFFDSAGNSVLVGGTDALLFVRTTTINTTGSMVDPGDGEAWDFAQFNNYVIATAAGNSPKYLANINSSTSWVDLPGSPPNAKRCARVGEFLLLGHIGGNTTQIQWSHYNDPTASWTASRLTQAGSATLSVADGAIQRIVGGRYATVFQQRAITRLSYVGPPSVFRADIVTTERGAVAPFGVVSVGYMSFFLSQDGFFVTNGSSVEPIGGQRINRWFFEECDQTKITYTQGAIDWQNRCVVWAFMSSGSSGFDRLLIYHYIEQKWSSAEVAGAWLTGSTLDGLDIDSLDAIYTDLDSIPYSLDSDDFKAKDRRFAAYVFDGTDSEYSTFTGQPMEAVWETGEFQPQPGRNVFVSEVTPVIDAEDWNMTVSLSMRNHLGQKSASAETTTGWGGFAPVRGEGRRVSITLTKPSGDWSEATGLDVNFRIAGAR